MSRIQNSIEHAKIQGATLSLDDIMPYASLHDLKEYIAYLQKENQRKDETIRELIIENVKLEVQLSHGFKTKRKTSS